MKIGVSSGTATVLDLHKTKSLVDPTTAYFMIGNQCKNNCSFCNRSKTSAQKLSRVTWPLFETDLVINSLKKACDENKIQRVCFQVTSDGDEKTFHFLVEIINKIKKNNGIDLSVSAAIENDIYLSELFKAGANNIAIPIDCATKEIFEQVKKKDWDQTLNFLYSASDKYRKKITTHLIVGLGETEEEAVKRLIDFHKREITTALFAFTPLSDSDMREKKPPSMFSYRRIQLAHWLIREEKGLLLSFEEGIIKFDKKIYKLLEKSKDTGNIFKTSGCSSCNRPFYNERPGQIPYNYPKDLNEKQLKDALDLALK